MRVAAVEKLLRHGMGGRLVVQARVEVDSVVHQMNGHTVGHIVDGKLLAPGFEVVLPLQVAVVQGTKDGLKPDIDHIIAKCVECFPLFFKA